MGKLGILSLVLCVIGLLSCGKKKNVRTDFEAFIGKEIVFPDKSFKVIGNKVFKDRFLLISYVDSGNCTPCALGKMQYMKTNKRQLLDAHTGILMVVHEKILLLLMKRSGRCMLVIRSFSIHWDVLRKKMEYLIALCIKISL